MTRLFKLRPLVAAAVLCLGALSAAAADFRITVPVELSNLPEGAEVYVHCYVRASAGAVVGEGFTRHPGLDFVGADALREVFVEIDATGRLLSRADATHFDCTLVLLSEAVTVTAEQLGYMDQVESWVDCVNTGLDPRENLFRCGAEGTKISGTTSGAFLSPLHSSRRTEEGGRR